MSIDPRMLTLAGRQHGLISRPQLADLGIGSARIHRLQRAGVLQRAETAVYIVTGHPSTFEQQVLGPILSVHGLAAASHGTAARLLGLRGFERHNALHVTVPRQLDPTFAKAEAHRSLILERADLTMVGAIPTVRPERAIITAAAERPRTAGGLIDSALLAGLTTCDRLWRYLGRYGGPGCPGAAAVRAQLLRRAPLQAPTESALEDAWLAALEARGLTGWVRQHPIATDDGIVRIDLARPDDQVAVEVDSRLWHSSEADYRRERRKRYLLARLGYRLFPVTEFDLHERVDEVAADLHAAIRRAA